MRLTLLRFTWISVSLILGLTTTAIGKGPAMTPLPRIQVQDGQFVDTKTGAGFFPHGFNYAHLRAHPRVAGAVWHGTFSKGTYDFDRVESMFADCAAHGYNLVRVFIDQEPLGGLVESKDDSTFAPYYMANVFDFLRRGRENGVYVIFTFPYLAQLKPYTEMAAESPVPPYVGGGNALLVHEPTMRAKATYIADFVAAIRQEDAALLSTVFSYELDNECFFMDNEPPFSLREGKVAGPNGKTYDMASDADAQRLADDALAMAADLFVKAVRKVDPEVMTSIDLFTFNAVGLPNGPESWRGIERKWDRRFPGRPLALVHTQLSYIDIHLYGISEPELKADLASSEWDKVRVACEKAGKPVIIGEFGAFRAKYPELPAAVTALRAFLDRTLAQGFAGYLLWTYDMGEGPEIWHGLSGNGEIRDALVQSRKRQQDISR
jgi:cellulase (glycosyl hydrolase family 5)